MEVGEVGEKIRRQGAEFDAMAKLAKAYARLPPIVDDDYPEMRHYYESAMQQFAKALRLNRPELFTPPAAAAPKDGKFTSLRAANAARQKLWGSASQGPLYRAVELAGEVGELCNVVKKLEREKLGLVGSRATKEQLEDELGDGLICLSLLALEYGIDLDAAAARKFNKTSEKLGFPIFMVTS